MSGRRRMHGGRGLPSRRGVCAGPDLHRHRRARMRAHVLLRGRGRLLVREHVLSDGGGPRQELHDGRRDVSRRMYGIVQVRERDVELREHDVLRMSDHRRRARRRRDVVRLDRHHVQLCLAHHGAPMRIGQSRCELECVVVLGHRQHRLSRGRRAGQDLHSAGVDRRIARVVPRCLRSVLHLSERPLGVSRRMQHVSGRRRALCVGDRLHLDGEHGLHVRELRGPRASEHEVHVHVEGRGIERMVLCRSSVSSMRDPRRRRTRMHDRRRVR